MPKYTFEFATLDDTGEAVVIALTDGQPSGAVLKRNDLGYWRAEPVDAKWEHWVLLAQWLLTADPRGHIAP